jgi:Fe2+ transport system protein FeoA
MELRYKPDYPRKTFDDGWRQSENRAMQLSELREGQTATIVHVGGNGMLRRRIQEMGILKGTEVYMEKYAPLRDPLELIVKGYHVSLRVEEAAQITVDSVK